MNTLSAFLQIAILFGQLRTTAFCLKNVYGRQWHGCRGRGQLSAFFLNFSLLKNFVLSENFLLFGWNLGGIKKVFLAVCRKTAASCSQLLTRDAAVDR